MNNPFPISPIFEWNYKTQKQIVINQGGTSSGKTYSLLQVLACKAAETPNQIITIVGQDIPNLKAGAIRDFDTILSSCDFFRSMIKQVNKSDKIYYFHNGSIMEFKSFDNEQDAKSGKRNYLFVNEANGIPYSIYDQLQIRTSKQVFIDYNPSAPFWVHDKLIGDKKTELFISNYTHNPFLKDSIRAKIEKLKSIDSNKWRVYGLGLTGRVEGIVFPNVEWIHELPTTNIKRMCYGVDFGYTNDPTTIVKCVLSQGQLYGELLCYETGLTNPDIAEKFRELGIKSGLRTGNLIMADSAEPKSIKELRNLGYRVKGCKKGADSIRQGIDMLKSYGSLQLVNNELWKQEQQKYVWTIDRKDGKAKNKPVDKFNHIWDAFRYGEQGIRKIRQNVVSYGQ
jgi:phage terminase large subunit